MVTIVPVVLEDDVPRALEESSHESSQDGSPRNGVCRHHPQHHLDRQHHGLRHRRSSPTGVGRRHHHHHPHHHPHHHRGPYSIAHRHGRGDHAHHGSPHRGHRGRHAFLHGFHDIGMRGQHGPLCRRRHRSLSPHHLMHHDRSVEGFHGSPHRGYRGQWGHGGDRHSRAHRFHHDSHSQERNSQGSETNPSLPIPSAIEQGIAQLGQLSLRA